MTLKNYLLLFLLIFCSNLYSQSHYKTGNSNILNAENPDEIGVRQAYQIQEDKDEKLEYGVVDDKDILWSTTVWEIVDLDQRVNYPLLYPVDTLVVGKERRPMLWWLRQEIERLNIPVYDPGYSEGEFLEKVEDNEIENIFKQRENTPEGDRRLTEITDELALIISDQYDKFGFNPYEEEFMSEEQKLQVDNDSTFVRLFPHEIRNWGSYKLLTDRSFSYQQYLGYINPDGPVRVIMPGGYADPLTAEEGNEYNSALQEVLETNFFEENVDFTYKKLEFEDLKQWLIKGVWYFDKKYSELIYRPIGIAPVAKPLNAPDEDGGQNNVRKNEDLSIPPVANGPDQDNDGISDDDERSIELDNGKFTDPTKADTDGDGVDDGVEAKNGFDPTDPTDGERAKNIIFASKDDNKDNDNKDKSDGTEKVSQLKPLFWVFYPHARDILKKGKAFNNRNTSKYISFDDIINSRRFSAVIYKEENVYENREVKDYIKNNSFMRLLESERIKEKIRNFEHDMWSW